MTSDTITAQAAGTWTLGDLPVSRIGFGAMRLTGRAAFHLGVENVAAGTLRLAEEELALLNSLREKAA